MYAGPMHCEAHLCRYGSRVCACAQDALGRSALMFAAGNDARAALAALLGAGASIAARDRRGRSVLEYAAEHAAAHRLLEDRCARALCWPCCHTVCY